MAFGVKREELIAWKKSVENGKISFLTHYWQDERFPGCNTVTKVGCSDIDKLAEWGKQYQLLPQWIHRDETYPHFDLFGEKQREILLAERKEEQLSRFSLI
ncbi:hypothetical protein J2T56_003115 [Natronobacillus azotifigens]|uniref:YneQ n=1 Tax=Natronobacillus azotifigens TaxID=472978 RepID=A0A9J6RGP2_9BACI|nr:hypothetical protein [Natronobacillus azotifigens]MCZ0704499.1 hypothetical protein [Natronobacillus azotifigens]